MVSYLLLVATVLLVSLCGTVDGAILGTRCLSSSYKKSPGFLSGLSDLFNNRQVDADIALVPALSEISATFSNGVNCFVGPPNSGKSTLAKCIHHMTVQASTDSVDSQLVVDSGEILLTSPQAAILPVYLDPLYYLTYAADIPAAKLISLPRFNINAGRAGSVTARLREVLQLWKIPMDKPPVDMFESQRKLFEIVLSIWDAANKVTPPSSGRDGDEGRGGKDGGGDERDGEMTAGRKEEAVSIVLLLDEYFDKDVSVVLQKVLSSLRDPQLQALIQVQAFVVTHSRRVMDCADQVVCINAGTVFHQAPPKEVRLPNQLQFID